MLSFVGVMQMQLLRFKQNAKRNSESSAILSPSLSSGVRMTYFPNTVSGRLSSGLVLIPHKPPSTPVPVKYEHVVFCRLSDFQLGLYRLFISSPEIKALLRGTDSQPLKAINILKKLCNHPELLNLPDDLRGSEGLIPEGFGGAGITGRDRNKNYGVHCEWGGKFLVLERFSIFLPPGK